MTTTSTDPREIEAELERDRAELASTLDELSDRVSVDSLARDALNSVKSYAGSYTSTLDGAVRTNPIAVAMVGAGLAWLAFSGHRRSTASTSGDEFAGSPVHDEMPRYESEGGIPAASGFGSYAGGTPVGASSADDHSWWDSIQDLRSKATAALHRVERDAASALGSVRDRLPSLGGSGGSSGRDYDSERASVISGFTSGLRERFSSGLDSLPEPARQRIVAARQRAYQASLQAERVGRQAITDPARALEEHPLVAGAVAFALGAAAAAMLPRTEAEDRAFGGERDRLMDEAARLLRSERERAMQIAGGLVDEAKSAAGDILGEVRAAATEAVSDVVDTAKEKATGIASMVTERATEEAGRLADDAAAGGTGTGRQGGQGSSQGSFGGTAQGGDQGGMRGSGDPVIG